MSFMDTDPAPGGPGAPPSSGPGAAAAPVPPGVAVAHPLARSDSPRWRMLPVQEQDRAIPVVNRVSSGINIPVTHYPAHGNHQPAGEGVV